jgi:hypothetical protein
MATPPEDERFAAWMLQVTAHAVLSAVLGDETEQTHARPGVGGRGGLDVYDRAAIMVRAMEPLFRGLHPAVVAQLRRGIRCARDGATDQAMVLLFRACEPLAVMAGAELDLPARRKDDPGRC